MIFISNQESNLFKKHFMNENAEDHFFFQGGEHWSYLFFPEVKDLSVGTTPVIDAYFSSVTARILRQRGIFSWHGDFDFFMHKRSFMFMLPIGLKDNMLELLSVNMDKRLYRGYYEHFYVTQN